MPIPHHSRRHTYCDGIFRHIIDNDRTGSDDSARANARTLQDSDSMSYPRSFANDNATLAGKGLIHDRPTQHHAMIIAVKGTIRRNLNMTANRYIGNERMDSAPGLNMCALAYMDISTKPRFETTISIKVDTVREPNRSPCPVSRDHQVITDIHMLSG